MFSIPNSRISRMYPFPIKFLFALFIFFFTPSLSDSPIPPSNFITLHGDAFLNATTIILTKSTCCNSLPPPPFFPPSTAGGRAFFKNPFRLMDPSANASVSFSSTFSFTIANASSCPFDDGFAFLITPNTDFLSPHDGYMGLPVDGSDYFAVEFDTSFDPILGDTNGNHVGVDSNSIRSLASVDLISRQIDLKIGKELTAWIEYTDSEKSIRVWIGRSDEIKPTSPVLDAQIDLSNKFKEFVHVGFTASNRKGSSVYTVVTWRFKTFFRSPDITEQEYCLMCPSSNPGFQIDPSGFHHRPSNRETAVKRLLIFGGCVLAMMVLISLLTVCSLFWVRRRKRLSRAHSERQMRRKFQRGRNLVPKMLSLADIKSATNGFNQTRVIGEGASAVVYEGEIPSYGHVAIKRFNHENRVDSSISRIPFNTEFATMVGCLKHKNLVQLQGWCCEHNELVLVYEFMSNGSLDNILHNRTHLTKLLPWEKRLNVIIGVANALVYLHEECESQIIHRDVKTCNILLDSEFNAKLGDFGLAEVYRHSLKTRFATVPAGTMGYLAPGARVWVPSAKTDVYSFGVVVLEVATGRRPVDEQCVVITDYVWDLWEKGMIAEAADCNLAGLFDRSEMERVLVVGLCCAHPNSEKRPTMREAARMLRGEVMMPVLPSKKPTVRIQSAPLDGFDEILSFGAI